MKNRILNILVIGSFCVLLLPSLAQAKLTASSENHFILEHEVTVPLDTRASYRLLGKPSQWWSSSHT